MDVLHSFRRYLTKPHVRPWALSSPILVLLVCLPLLRPLRHPDPRDVSDDELARLATVQSVVERRTLSIESSDFVPQRETFRHGGHVYASQPPALSVVLAGPYWLMHRGGLTFQSNPSLVAYLLTLIGATIPVAAAAGLIYRMGRLFELPRKKRALLAAVVAFGGGLVSYGTVLNPHAPAAALLLGSAACIIHVAIARRPGTTSGWLAVAGMCAAFAAAIDPPAAVFVLLLACAIPVMRWRWPMRVGGVMLYALGAIPPLFLHGALTQTVTGDYVPPEYHQAFDSTVSTVSSASASAAADDGGAADDAAAVASSWWDRLGRNLARIAVALFGGHGIFSHFPVVILGAFGVAAVMHRHWPRTTKVLATASVAGGVAIIVFASTVLLSGAGSMFGPQAFVVFLPLLLFWAGAWIRREHHAVKWVLAGVLMAFSAAVTLIGATDPCPRNGYDRYTVAQALTNLVQSASATSPQSPAVLAGR
jgi:hypothetical protein